MAFRCSTAKAFLRPVRDRPNLHISLNSQVLKILIDNKSKAAFGVRLRKGEAVYTVLAKKEVILSAGTLNSAQLLMLSGVMLCCNVVQSSHLVIMFRCWTRRSPSRARYSGASGPPRGLQSAGSLRDWGPHLHHRPACQSGPDTIRKYSRSSQVRHIR